MIQITLEHQLACSFISVLIIDFKNHQADITKFNSVLCSWNNLVSGNSNTPVLNFLETKSFPKPLQYPREL